MPVMFNSRDAPRHASHQASSHGAKWCAGHSRFWPADLAARTIGEPGVIGARLEPDGSSEASHLDSPRALLYLWEWIRRYGGRFETEPPPAMGGGPRSIHRLLDSKRSSAFPRGHFLLVGG